jgi:hypothetical protein
MAPTQTFWAGAKGEQFALNGIFRMQMMLCSATDAAAAAAAAAAAEKFALNSPTIFFLSSVLKSKQMLQVGLYIYIEGSP